MLTILLQLCVIRALVILLLTALVCFFMPICYQKCKLRLSQKSSILSRALLEAIYKPLFILIVIMGLFYALESLCIAWKSIDIKQLHLIRDLSFISLVTWFLWRFVADAKEGFLRAAENKVQNKPIDKTLIHGLSQIAKLSIIILAALSVFQLFGFSIVGVLAFGGMGGIVIGFAAKDLLANLFGSLMLFLDRPFVIGEQISLPALKVEGTVEEIGWRVCRIRTPECRPVYIPNALFSNLVVENSSRMKYRRFYCRISLRYQDIVKVPAILQEIKSLLKENSAIDKNRSITVNLNELANTSLNLVVIAYTNTVNSTDFLTIQQALFLQLLACIQRHGAEWSFPSHNVYLNNAEGIELASSQNRNDR
ncbi:MAG: putative small-conductance mechanosensitive channel [Pseudomonadota bacterium]|jgi:MscS family membrane protein